MGLSVFDIPKFKVLPVLSQGCLCSWGRLPVCRMSPPWIPSTAPSSSLTLTVVVIANPAPPFATTLGAGSGLGLRCLPRAQANVLLIHQELGRRELHTRGQP